jgi:hypothetical protein
MCVVADVKFEEYPSYRHPDSSEGTHRQGKCSELLIDRNKTYKIRSEFGYINFQDVKANRVSY